jgi:hypothetical protein
MACLLNVEGQLAALEKVVDTPAEDFRFVRAQDWSVLGSLMYVGGADPAVMGGVPAGVTLPAAFVPAAPPAAARAARVRAADGRAAADRRDAPRCGACRRAQVALAAAQGGASATTVGGALDGGSRMGAAPVAAQWAAQASAPAKATQKIAAAALDVDAAGRVRDAMGIGFRLPIGRYALEKVYRFPVLAHWSFTTSEGATFERLMQKLDVGLLGSQPQPAELEPGAPTPPEPRRRRSRRPRSCRPATSAWPIAPAAATPSRAGTAARACRCRRRATAAAAPARTRPCRSPTPPTSCAASSPTGARTSRSPPRSRSAGCSRCRSSRWCRRWRAFAPSSSAPGACASRCSARSTSSCRC